MAINHSANEIIPSVFVFFCVLCLQSQAELKALDICEYAFHLKKDEVCINPYHYTKVDSQSQQPLTILVPKNLSTPQGGESSVTYTLDDLSNTVPVNIQYNNALK